MSDIADWLQSRAIDEVECLVPDMSGIARGKILPRSKFISGYQENGLRIPEDVFQQTVTGEYVEESEVISSMSRDLYMLPDAATMRLVPWYKDQTEPVAQVICDAYTLDDKPAPYAPREVLRKVLRAYEKAGLKPVVAPELEFYFVKKNLDADYPLEPPIGLSGRQEAGRQAYGIEAANEFDPIVEDIYEFCDISDIDVDTMAHEAGAAQMEINFNHGDPLELADQVFLFKRTVRQAAMRHGIYATFMAKPHQYQPGSSMHIHQSVVNVETGRNIFVTPSGRDSKRLQNYLGGLQKYIPAAMPLLAPNVNSYRRIAPYSDAPINVHWGVDNRTVGLRVPVSRPESRRIENRIAGADSNPYLAIAATLACGLIGLKERLPARRAIEGDAYKLAFSLPRHIFDGLDRFSHAKPLIRLLGEEFVQLFTEVRYREYDSYQQVISSWERENLLLNV